MGRYVGITENVSNAMTFKVLTEEGKVIHRSVVRSAAVDSAFVNRRVDKKADASVVGKDPELEGQDVVRSK